MVSDTAPSTRHSAQHQHDFLATKLLEYHLKVGKSAVGAITCCSHIQRGARYLGPVLAGPYPLDDVAAAAQEALGRLLLHLGPAQQRAQAPDACQPDVLCALHLLSRPQSGKRYVSQVLKMSLLLLMTSAAAAVQQTTVRHGLCGSGSQDNLLCR